MCCTGMSANTSTQGKAMSRERFLKTAQRKKSLNKNKGEPCCMRTEALLEAALTRIRSEWRRERECSEEDDFLEPSNKKMKLDNYDIDEFDFNDGTEEEEMESCFDTCTMINNKELSSKALWDDPEQVEDFFKKVSAHGHGDSSSKCENSPCNEDSINNNKCLNKDIMKSSGTVDGTCTAIDFGDTFLDSVDELSSDLPAYNPNYDVGSFTIEFDNIYKELFQNFIGVDSYRQTETTCS
uniref:Uncharacterized protein n=1 Tax=Clytia hemisphaerica TaxID=252671 RepID=A0A7M5VCL3_9CNID|eukprot:TCONS_00017395-protein